MDEQKTKLIVDGPKKDDYADGEKVTIVVDDPKGYAGVTGINR